MRRILAAGGAVTALVTFALVAGERQAHACGGCFAPRENESVVTDHRMVLTISSQQTTLYDQIRYSGSPESFAWVLPIADSNRAQLGLSADVVFASLDAMTQTTVQAPPLNCPSPPTSCASSNAAPTAGFSGGGGGDVTVNKHEVVGPYVTDYVHSTDPQALSAWLASHGYAVPADVTPVITQYVNEHYDFIAMKLVPGAGVSSMRPVRVTTPGASPVLPLRMVAAGTGPTVGVTLWVLGDGRYETQNFPSFVIQGGELVWDWNASRSNYAELRTQHEQALGGRGWEIESSLQFSQATIRGVISNGGHYYGGGGYGGAGGYPASDATGDYQAVPAGDGGADAAPGETAQQVRDDDLTTLFAGIDPNNTRVTRIRADLARAALDQDLRLQASTDQAVLSNVRVAQNEANQPSCPVYEGCDVVGTAPRDQAAARMGSPHGESFGCKSAPVPAGGPLAAGAVAAMVAFAGLRRRRPRR